ncbi:radiation sensitive protein rad9 [Fusarium falciforme]|uniref:Radiation sensitive protein rad9 n=1 Tax=Fusarium falciforme TaxID=195108 RepID=A0A9W8QV83_9HYPO|nr:radiation sensitive protein rad9 [Fusarium falciforme]KAJ4179202.1 radiation sensitive protein rad9 [Fusarium falciforme]
MTHSEMLAHAGSNESQDSQAILEAYRAEFGVGALSSPPSKVSFSRTRMTTIKEIPSPTNEVVVPSSDTPVATIASPEVHAPRDALPTEARPEGSTVEQGECPEPSDLNGDEEDSEDRVDLTSNESLDSQRPCDLSHHTGNEKLHTRHDSAQPQSVQRDAPGPLIQSVKPPTSAAAAALLRKMDFSQQTPTQVNDGRDYGEYCDVVPSSPVNNDTQSGSHEPETLQDDDTGAVNFALSELNRPSSQVSEDAGFENTRGDWRHPDQTSQLNAGQTPCRPHGNAFETPAVPKNPFGARPSITAPLAGSQLFGQTQFSSAIKRISPTSSRPSPNLFNSISPNIIETSPLKNRANVSSPTDIRTSSPQRLHDIPETSLQDEDADPRGAETPLNSRSTGGDMIPESPPSSDPTPRAQPRSSCNTEPMTHYEPMKKSQERKSSEGAAVSSPLDSDSDPDDAIRRMERKKKIERKRAKAAEEMGRVSFIPMAKRESAEQPSRKKRRISTAVSVPAHEQPQEKTDNAKAQELPTLVDDSQKGVVASNETAPGASTKATPGNSAPEKEQVDGDGDLAMVDTQKVTEEEDMIPATSPAPSLPPSLPPTEASLPPTAPPEDPLPSEPELPKLIVDDEDGPGAARGDSEPSSLPPQRRRNVRTYGRSLRQSRKTPFVSSSNSDALVAETAPKPMSLSSPPRKPESMATIEHGDDHGLVARKGTPDEDAANFLELEHSLDDTTTVGQDNTWNSRLAQL